MYCLASVVGARFTRDAHNQHVLLTHSSTNSFDDSEDFLKLLLLSLNENFH